MEERPEVVRPGLFGSVVAADTRRGVFDSYNEQILAERRPVAAVFAGDSITEMWDLPVYFASDRGLVVNRGIGGDVTQFLRRRFEADVLQLRPQLLVLKIGINNTWVLDEWVAPEMVTPPQSIADAIVADITAMVRVARDAGITVALGSILPVDIPSLASNGVRNQLVAAVNADLRTVASELGAIYIDYHAALAQSDGRTLRPGLADDGLHPHLLGYRIMADVLLRSLDDAGVAALHRAFPRG